MTAQAVTGTGPPWYVRPQARRWTCQPAPAQAGRFHASLPGYAPTPLVELPGVAAALAVGRVFVKDESARFDLGAFKFLGASWAAYRLVAQLTGYRGDASLNGLRGWLVGRDPLVLVTATDGNHGRAVARTAALLGLRSRVFVPAGVPAAAVARVLAEGADLTEVAGSYDDAVAAALQDTRLRPGCALVQDTAWPGYEDVPGWTVDGYSTLLHEVDAQLAGHGIAAPDLVAVPVGVGSLAQAVVVHHRSRSGVRPPALLSVEPDTAACVLASLARGRLHTIGTPGTLMNGLNCGTPSSLAWPYLRDGLDAAVAVSDAQAADAVGDLAEAGVTSGPNGAASLAGTRVALTGPGSGERRAALAVADDSVVVLLSTEGFAPDAPDGPDAAWAPAQRRSASRAACQPPMPCTPPPGGVLDEHRNSPGTGVRHGCSE